MLRGQTQTHLYHVPFDQYNFSDEIGPFSLQPIEELKNESIGVLVVMIARQILRGMVIGEKTHPAVEQFLGSFLGTFSLLCSDDQEQGFYVR